MKKAASICMVIALCLVLVGVGLFVVVLAQNDWDFSALGKGELETRSFDITEDFHSISVRTETDDIIFLPADGDGCRVEVVERKKEPHQVYVKDGTLNVEYVEKKNWLHVSFFSFGSTKITVWLPKEAYEALTIQEDTGDVKLSESLRFGSINVSASTGDVECRASASGEVKIATDTGDIRLEGISAQALTLSVSTGRVEVRDTSCQGCLDVTTSTGRTELTALTCGSLRSKGSTGSLIMKDVTVEASLQAERSTGDIRMEGCDAAELNLVTDTGNVTGSLRSDKIFMPKSDTGSIQVPETVTGGKCKITTDTGDIKIEIVG